MEAAKQSEDKMSDIDFVPSHPAPSSINSPSIDQLPRRVGLRQKLRNSALRRQRLNNQKGGINIRKIQPVDSQTEAGDRFIQPVKAAINDQVCNTLLSIYKRFWAVVSPFPLYVF